MRFYWLLALCVILGACSPAPEQAPLPTDASWAEIEARAQGQTVYFNAWGGDPRINAYIAWAGEQLREQHGIELIHVKLSDTAEAVTRILAEQAAGRDQGGLVDLLWLNGENFASLKQANMLYGPIAERLPNHDLIDYANEPAFSTDFTLPVEGLQVPWGMSALVLITDQDRVAELPKDPQALLAWAKAHPGRFSYPTPPNFVGTSFLKQLLLTLHPDPAVFYQPAGNEAAAQLKPLWAYLEQLHPHLWRQGQGFPTSGPAQRQLLADRELDFALSFNPSEALGAVLSGQLPESTVSYAMLSGTLTNAHFLAIPANARAKAAALVAINFLISVEAQDRKARPDIWGDASALKPELLNASTALPAIPTPLLEPHPSWTLLIEQAWAQRFAQ